MRMTTLSFSLVLTCCAGVGFAQEIDMVDPSFLANAHSKAFHPTPHDLTNGKAHSRFGIFGIDSIPNFNGQFFADGFDFNGNPNRHWYINTVGNPPQMGRTTLINAPVQAVNVELDDANGNLRIVGGHPLISDATQFVAPVLGSPVFSNATYSSGPDPTQFTDAVQRAEFFNKMKPDWHTLLNPQVPPALTVHFRQATTCAGGFTGCNYYFSLNANGTCCRLILVDINAFFNGLADVVVTDIVGNVITTQDISSFLFPNTFLYFGDRRDCCVLGFHTYFFQPGTDPEKRWVLNYSSWITPGLFGPNFLDVTALSHEIAETYNDPFVVSDNVHNLTPFWLSPNGNCQDDLETGDVIEGLLNSTFPVLLNGFTYHPQNEALIQWFEFESPSSALGGAYSYPNATVLPHLSPPQKFNCAP
ncbi:MAG TPA: hypothetical protein VNX18_06940 [Bryobacteraceae bacterium]|nr:hypothetical protein [Bryobacteraceae bacterium]